MAVADLKTHCAECDGLILIARDAAQHTRRIECPHCGSPGYVWQLIGAANRRQTTSLNPLAGRGKGPGRSGIDWQPGIYRVPAGAAARGRECPAEVRKGVARGD